MKKLILVTLMLIITVTAVFAQDDAVKMDAGLRGGVRSGVSARYFLSEDNCLELLATTRGFSGWILTGLYEFHKPLDIIEGVEGLSWYFGGGVHLGYWVAGSVYGTDLALGIDGIIGAEYDLSQHIDFPVSVSLDYKPGFDIFGKWAGTFGDVAVSLRYEF